MKEPVDNIFIEGGIVEDDRPNLLERAVKKRRSNCMAPNGPLAKAPDHVQRMIEGQGKARKYEKDGDLGEELTTFYGPPPEVDPDRVNAIINRSAKPRENPWSADAADVDGRYLVPKPRPRPRRHATAGEGPIEGLPETLA